MNRIYSVKFCENDPNCLISGGWLDFILLFAVIGMIYLIFGI